MDCRIILSCIFTAVTMSTVSAAMSESGTIITEYSSVGFQGQTLTVDEGIRVIGEGAFAGSAMEIVSLPSTLDSIGPYAFAGCRSLKYITLPSSVRHIGRNAFSGCDSLESVTFPPEVQTIGDEAFQSTAITAADLSDCGQLNYVGAWAFALCTEIKSVALPPSEGIILGEGVFMGCPMLKSVNAPATGDIPPYAFAGCTSADLSEMMKGNSGGTIGEYAFSGNTATDSISLPHGLEYVGSHSMERMTSLSHIDAFGLEMVPATGDNVWEGVDQPNVNLLTDPEMADKFASAPQWQEFHIGLTTSVTEGRLNHNSLGIEVRSGQLSVLSEYGDIQQIEIIDTKGVIISVYRPGANEFTADISNLRTSVYIVRVNVSGSGPQTFTFIK